MMSSLIGPERPVWRAGDDDCLTTGDVAKLLQVTREGVRWIVRAGNLRCERTRSGVRLFRRGTVRHLADEREDARLLRRSEQLVTLRLRMVKADREPRQLALDFSVRLKVVGSAGKGRKVA